MIEALAQRIVSHIRDEFPGIDCGIDYERYVATKTFSGAHNVKIAPSVGDRFEPAGGGKSRRIVGIQVVVAGKESDAAVVFERAESLIQSISESRTLPGGDFTQLWPISTERQSIDGGVIQRIKFEARQKRL